MRVLGIVVIWALANWASAIELKFGPEFTLSNSEIMASQPVNRMQEGLGPLRREYFKNPKLKEHYEQLVALLQRRLVSEKSPESAFKIIQTRVDAEDRLALCSPSGWTATLGLDPGVIEWTLSPMTLMELQRHRAEIQYVLFDLPKEIGMEPMLFAGGGHINLGAAAFVEKRDLLLDFITDFLNHSELSLGIFNYDTNNALSYWLVPSKANNLRYELAMLRRPQTSLSDREFARLLGQILSAPLSDEYLEHFRPSSYTFKSLRNHSWALAFKSDEQDYPRNDLAPWRLEIRSVRPQTSFDLFLRQIELLQSRLNFIERSGAPVELKNRHEIFYDRPFQDRVFNPPLDPQEALSAFRDYVTESGLPWEDHQDYIWPMWISGGELAKFRQSLNCKALLTEEFAL